MVDIAPLAFKIGTVTIIPDATVVFQWLHKLASSITALTLEDEIGTDYQVPSGKKMFSMQHQLFSTQTAKTTQLISATAVNTETGRVEKWGQFCTMSSSNHGTIPIKDLQLAEFPSSTFPGVDESQVSGVDPTHHVWAVEMDNAEDPLAVDLAGCKYLYTDQDKIEMLTRHATSITALTMHDQLATDYQVPSGKEAVVPGVHEGGSDSAKWSRVLYSDAVDLETNPVLFHGSGVGGAMIPSTWSPCWAKVPASKFINADQSATAGNDPYVHVFIVENDAGVEPLAINWEGQVFVPEAGKDMTGVFRVLTSISGLTFHDDLDTDYQVPSGKKYSAKAMYQGHTDTGKTATIYQNDAADTTDGTDVNKQITANTAPSTVDRSFPTNNWSIAASKFLNGKETASAGNDPAVNIVGWEEDA